MKLVREITCDSAVEEDDADGNTNKVPVRLFRFADEQGAEQDFGFTEAEAAVAAQNTSDPFGQAIAQEVLKAMSVSEGDKERATE